MGGVPNSSLSGDLEDETGHLRRRIGQRDLCIRGMGQEREPRGSWKVRTWKPVGLWVVGSVLTSGDSLRDHGWVKKEDVLPSAPRV